MIRRPPRSTPLYSSAASDVYKRQLPNEKGMEYLMAIPLGYIILLDVNIVCASLKPTNTEPQSPHHEVKPLPVLRPQRRRVRLHRKLHMVRNVDLPL
eukprot:TRINITY_DN3635_c0_g1_i13.p2 TRINITY_DN3635_c0_g1~~TRINITY_DN3635_c0_g1_i13.p2  ORF type:complete len:104 (+),score=18.21 TRINITY_DN3635_c0_g1_i13:23-313(+)